MQNLEKHNQFFYFVVLNIFFYQVAQARGVEILAGVEAGLTVYEYTPLQIKQGIVGYGRAEKRQVQEMVKTILNLNEIRKPDDAADAIAVAICH